jgi:acyl-CoA thioesterase-1
MRTCQSTVLAIVAITAATALLTGCAGGDRFSVSATPAAAKTSAAEPVVVAIGDSIMKGHGLPADQAWPALLAKQNHWQLTNLACDGAGFATEGDTDDCGSDFSALVSKAVTLHPSLVIISGSSNDLGVDDAKLLPQTAGIVGALRSELPSAKIVSISTIWNDTAVPDQVYIINEQVRAAVDAAGGTYLDVGQPLAGHRDWLQADDVHPTAKGQQILATRIAAAIRSAKLTF